MLLGITMFLNVWGVIWRNQKMVIANARNVLAGGEADPNAAAAGRKALLASRQNTIFSFADADVHGRHEPLLRRGGFDTTDDRGIYWAITGVHLARARAQLPRRDRWHRAERDELDLREPQARDRRRVWSSWSSGTSLWEIIFG